jgi:hypothetical protein
MTYPYGTEDELVESMIKSNIFPNLEKDKWGNYYYKIGNSKTVFASHLDTACKDQVKVNHVVSNQQIVTTDGTSILGADDKAGITILLWMIENRIPGLYYFFIGEEVGCIGSGDLAKSNTLSGYDRIISFDRRGTNSVITYQSSYRCCSDKFADELANQLNRTKNFFYKKDDSGVYTDSAEFVSQIPECTNISVGYMKEHTHSESQDLYHLYKLAESCLEVDWENLPTIRNPKEKDYLWQDYQNYQHCGYSTRNEKRKRTRRSKSISSSSSSGNYSRGNSRVFYDNCGELVEYDKSKSNGIYDSLKDRFLDSNLTKGELEVIKKQSLDMSIKSDKEIYDTLYKLL